MFKYLIALATSPSLLAFISGSVFASGPYDNNNNNNTFEPHGRTKKIQGYTDVNALYEERDCLRLIIKNKTASKKAKADSLEKDLCHYLKTNKVAHITALSLEIETSLTAKMVQHLVDYCPNLSFLHLNGFTNVENAEIIQLGRLYPNIVILDETEEIVLCYPAFGHQAKPVAWSLLKPVLDQAMRKTIANPAYVARSFSVDVHRDDFEDFHNWLEAFEDQYLYPIGIGLSGLGAEGEKVNGKYEIYHENININNYTKKEESARNVNEYRFFGGNLDKKLVNEITFYNLMARVGFTEEAFKNGATGLQGRIAVKPIQLKGITLDDCKNELADIILPTLEKSAEAYITFIFNLPIGAKFKLNDIFQFEENVGFEKDGRFHGITKENAFELVRDYIYEQYDDFKEECKVLTGKGNHQNANGSKGVLCSAFPKWMKDESIAPFIRKFIPIMGGGGFRVLLNKPRICDLTAPHLPEDPLYLIAKKLKQVIDAGEDRLLIKTNDEGLDHKLSHYLCLNGQGLIGDIPPMSYGREDGQLRLMIFGDDSDEFMTSSEEDLKDNAPQAPAVKVAQAKKQPKPVQVPAKKPAQKKQQNKEQKGKPPSLKQKATAAQAKQPVNQPQAKKPAKQPEKSVQTKQGPKPEKQQPNQNPAQTKQPGKPAQAKQGPKQPKQQTVQKPAKAKQPVQPQAKNPAKMAQPKAAPKKANNNTGPKKNPEKK
jgi:hypothetical protein